MSDPLVCVKDFEDYANLVLPRNALDFYKRGAGAEKTLALNREAFSKYKIRPRCLRNVAQRDLSTTILGRKVEFPVGISPTALHKMAHPDGECATARAAQAMGTIFVQAHGSSCSIEEIAKAAPNGNNWFQVYMYTDKEFTRNLVQRAEKANFKAIVVTVDVPVIGHRRADIRNKFVVPSHLTFANFGVTGVGLQYYSSLMDTNLGWNDIKWLQSVTKLPIVVKGILTGEDAIIAADLGVGGIVVSNHGGRQLDGTPATIEVLPEVVKAVGGRTEIYIDGGIIDGADAFKALALGARMVFMGRPPIWGLVHSGEEGVKKVLDIVRTELDFALAISGYTSFQNIEPNTVVPEGFYSKL